MAFRCTHLSGRAYTLTKKELSSIIEVGYALTRPPKNSSVMRRGRMIVLLLIFAMAGEVEM